MQLKLDPSTGELLTNAERVATWRIQLFPLVGRGAPRIVRDDEGPCELPPDATEQDVLDLLEQEDITGRKCVARGVDESGKFVLQREIDLPLDEPDAVGGAPTETATDQINKNLTTALVEGFRVLAWSLDRVTSNYGPPQPREESESEGEGSNLMRKIEGLFELPGQPGLPAASTENGAAHGHANGQNGQHKGE